MTADGSVLEGVLTVVPVLILALIMLAMLRNDDQRRLPWARKARQAGNRVAGRNPHRAGQVDPGIRPGRTGRP